jgi:hypothetical protein
MRKKLRWLLLVPVLLVALIAFAPWQVWVEKKMVSALEEKGFSPVTLTIDHIGLGGITLRDVSLGEPALKLSHVTVGYNPRALLNGQLNAIRIDGLSVRAFEADTGWKIEGLPAFPKSQTTQSAAAIPVTDAALAILPFSQLELANSSLSVSKNGLEASIPVTLLLQHGTPNMLRLSSNGAEVKTPALGIAVGAMTAELTLDAANQKWQGNWALNDVVATSDAMVLPALSAKGTLALTADTVRFTGNIASADKTYEAVFDGHYALNKPESAALQIAHAKLPWSGGVISLNKATIPLAAHTAMAFTLSVDHVAIDSLMQALTGNQATASGVVSGQLPIRISKTGDISVGKSALKADGPGIIALSPDVIPGDNAQVTIVRDLLKNLHYTVLALELDMAPDNTLNATLAVEGSNPDVEKGRAVKLNVHLSGDLLNFVVQNKQLLTDPQSFIEQKNHE